MACGFAFRSVRVAPAQCTGSLPSLIPNATDLLALEVEGGAGILLVQINVGHSGSCSLYGDDDV